MKTGVKNIFNSSECIPEKTMFDYIDKKLSNYEEHCVEKHLLDCELCSDALEGLHQIKNRNRVHAINIEIEKRLTEKNKGRIIYFNFRKVSAFAAGIALLIGAVVFFKYSGMKEAQNTDMAVLDKQKNEEKEPSFEINTVNKTLPNDIINPAEKEMAPEKKSEKDKSEGLLQESGAAKITDEEANQYSWTKTVTDDKAKEQEALKNKSSLSKISKNEENKQSMEDAADILKKDASKPTTNTTTDNITTANSQSITMMPQTSEKTVEQKENAKAERSENRNNNGSRDEFKKTTGKSKYRETKVSSNAGSAAEPPKTSTENYDADNSLLNNSKADSIMIFDYPEQVALFPGGNDSLNKYIVEKTKNIKRTNDINNTKILVQFIVDAGGNIQSPKIIKGINKKVDAEILKIVSEMPKWIPAKQNGKSVKSRINLPIQLEIK